MAVKFLDLQAAQAELGGALEKAVAAVLSRAYYVLGPETAAFEQEWAEFTGSGHCVTVNSGLDALSLALRAVGVGPGDEVLVPSHTFIATWLAASHLGATVRPVEPRPGSYLTDPADLEAAMSAATRAVVPVHLYGEARESESLAAACRARGIALIVDAAQAHGAQVGGRPVGSWGTATCWSFYPGKNLGALGDGGAVTTDDAALADELRLLRNYGCEQKYVHVRQGINTRLDEVQAAALRVKLRRLPDWNERRRQVAEAYREGLAGSGLTLPPEPAERAAHVWHLFAVRHARRDALAASLADRGVDTLIHYPIPCHRQEAYSGAALGDLPVCEAISREVLSLPMGPTVTPADVREVVAAVGAALA